MAKGKTSETITENIFRSFFGAKTFIEKSARECKLNCVNRI